uniref:Uncharacterized protein n=1 Tax=Panagrolaimus davidi TaxID=227884 RepID=A0A914PKJ3_9BILA
MDSLAHDIQTSIPIITPSGQCKLTGELLYDFDEQTLLCLRENPIPEEDLLLLLHFESQDINDYEMIKTALENVNGKEASKYIFKFDTADIMFNARASMRRSNPGLFYLFGDQPTIRTTVVNSFDENSCDMNKYQFFEI